MTSTGHPPQRLRLARPREQRLGVLGTEHPLTRVVRDDDETRRDGRDRAPEVTRLAGRRVDPGAGEGEDDGAAIAPGFVVIAHDPSERVFCPEHAEALLAWAGEPKALWWVPGGGHGRSMLTPDLLERVRVEVSERLGRAPAPRR